MLNRRTRARLLCVLALVALLAASLPAFTSVSPVALAQGEEAGAEDGGDPFGEPPGEPEGMEPEAIDPNAIDPNAGFDPDAPLIMPLDIPGVETGVETGAEDADPEAVDPVMGAALDLPALQEAWGDSTTVSVGELAELLGDFARIETNGDFTATYLENADAPSLRILPVAESGPTDAPLVLEVAWVFNADSPLGLPAGSRLDVELGARLYSPPTGVTLSIREQVDGEWQSSSVAMQEIQWATYTLARAISPAAEQVELVLHWEPELENAWIEVQLPRIVADRDEVVADPLSPTDTPTPVPTPTPDVSPTPEATPTSTPTPTLNPTPTPLPQDDLAAGQERAAEDSGDAADDGEGESEGDGESEGEDAEEEPAIETPTLTPVIVTSTPTPVDVFEEATRVAQATAWAPILGTNTPTPENMVTPTNTPEPTETPTPFVIIVTNTPIPQNMATATYAARFATAVAFTTGTPTPYPEEAEVLVATHTPVPAPKPTNTPTPLYILLEDVPPTAEPKPTPEFPEQLVGKIMFLSRFRTSGSPNVLIMNGDGSELGIMGTRLWYNRAVAREPYSADRRFFAYVQREGTEANGRWWQIKFDDYEYDDFRNPMTFYDNGNAWSPVWSPTRQQVAYVSNNSGNDEIYLVDINEWPPRQLTENEWEWDQHPSFSPDGSQIVFMSNRNTGTRQIWMMDAGGGNQRQITNFPFDSWNPVWVKYPDS